MEYNPNINPQYQLRKEKIILAAEIIGLVLVVLMVLFAYSKKFYNRVDDIDIPFVSNPTHNAVSRIDRFVDLELTAKSAVVLNTKTGEIIFQKNEKDVLPLASLTKLMTAVTAVEILPQDSTVRIAQEYLAEEDAAGLFANEKWKAADLMAFTLVASSNVGARAIATAAGALLPHNTSVDPRDAFISELNSKAKALDLDSLTFYNDTGLDLNETQAGAYGNAVDIAELTQYILKKHPELLEPTKHTKLDFISQTRFLHKVKNTNQDVVTVPGIIGSKTGYTDLAQGNLVVAFGPGLDGPYVAVVLGSTFDGRFTDMQKLISATVESNI
jgi:D-alanyl-D-alanine carboxypeptidase (penicillin-binding protein 5/6)